MAILALLKLNLELTKCEKCNLCNIATSYEKENSINANK